MSVTAYEMLNTIRANADALYQDRVPEATKTNLHQVGQAITSDSNIMNSFIDALVNKIALSHVKNKLFKNPLARLKGVGRPYGNTIEEIYINPSIDAGYDTDGTKLLKTTKPDGKVCYFGLNRQSSYPITINENELQRAFTSEQEFNSLYNGIVTAMISGDNIDEFMLTKGVIAKAVDDGSVEIIESDLSAPKELAKAMSLTSKMFSFPSKNYNGYNKVNATSIAGGETPCITYCDMSNQTLLLRADAETEINYEYLANVFNLDLAQIKAMTILVDSFPSEKYDIYAVLCDNETIQIRDTQYKTTSQYIASSLQWNLFLHHWQFLFLSMFGNCVAFAKTKASE